MDSFADCFHLHNPYYLLHSGRLVRACLRHPCVSTAHMRVYGTHACLRHTCVSTAPMRVYGTHAGLRHTCGSTAHMRAHFSLRVQPNKGGYYLRTHKSNFLGNYLFSPCVETIRIATWSNSSCPRSITNVISLYTLGTIYNY